MEVEKEGENIRYTHSVNLVHVLCVQKYLPYKESPCN